MLRYAITNLTEAAPGSTAAAMAARQRLWLDDLARWSEEGIGYVQLREKTLQAGELFTLLNAGMAALAGRSRRPRVLVNGRPDLAAAAGADGVHLSSRAGELQPAQARAVLGRACTVSVSCHDLAEVKAARECGADLLLFGPVFEKRCSGTLVVPGTGTDSLQAACTAAGPVPVLALGGVTAASWEVCLSAGAAGVAGIRLFAGGERRDRTAPSGT